MFTHVQMTAISEMQWDWKSAPKCFLVLALNYKLHANNMLSAGSMQS